MKILVLNCGSSSLKYQLIEMDNESVLAIGICERIGIEGARIKHEATGKEKFVKETEMKNHQKAIEEVIAALLDKDHGVISNVSEISAVGHRIVHGGEFFTKSAIITEEVKKAVKKCIELAPLHNPPNLIGIEACEKLMPNLPQVGVFDTAFHQTMPEKAYIYPLEYDLYKKYKIRKYGFHGTSHKYVSNCAAEFLGKPIEELKLITCHIGNGASVCAIDGGKSVDTSMGFTPLEGLAMGTRCGDIDPAIVQFIMEKENKTIEEVTSDLNKKSGVLGISGISSDFRDLENAVSTNPQAELALDIFHYKVAKYVGGYAASMNGVDAVIFTAGIGENSDVTRAEVCSYLGYLGLTVDDSVNNGLRGKMTDISTKDSKVRALLIPTNEELVIARDTKELIK